MKLRQIIESPIPDADSLNDFYHHSGSFSFRENIGRFKKRFPIIGQGSSRVVFSAPIDISWLKADDIEKVGNKQTGIKTAIKLAKNAKGLFQNAEELRIYEIAKHMNKERFLCPIIDWAGNPAYKNDIVYTISSGHDFEAKNGSRKAPFWLQMPQVITPSAYTFKKFFSKQFGFNPEFSLTEYNYMSSDEAHAEMAADVYAQACDQFSSTKEQEDEFADFLSLANAVFGTGIVDMNNPANWGILDGKLVIIDFGYSEDVQDTYSGHVNMETAVVNNEIVISIEE